MLKLCILVLALLAVLLLAGLSWAADGSSPTIFDYAAGDNGKIAELERAIIEKVQAHNIPEAEAACRRLVEQVPFYSRGYYFLACFLAAQGKNDEAFKSLSDAVTYGFNDVKTLSLEPSLAAVRKMPGYQQLVTMAAHTQPPILSHRAVAAAVKDRVAMVSDGNTEYDPKTGLLITRFAGDTTAAARPVTDGKDEDSKLLDKWYQDGTAAGNVGDLYDNRDSDHSDLDKSTLPQLTWIEYSPEAQKARLQWGLQTVFMHDGIVIGNASVAETARSFWRSMPRMACCTQKGASLLYSQYRSNKLYVYPSHKDYWPGHNGKLGDKPGEHGDVYPANTPYIITSLGSSFTDKVFLQAAAYTLAAFHPNVKRFLANKGALMPTLQMIFRMSNKQVAKEPDYLTGAAHPPVFRGDQIDRAKMAKIAHDMTRDNLPPIVQLKVIEEDKAVQGRDYFDAVESEVLFDTPCAIARVMRSVKQKHRIVVSAEDSFDLNKKKLTYKWVVLQGDAAAIKITPKNASGSIVEIVVPYFTRRPIQTGSDLETNRVDIGVFAGNGTYYSAPGFVTFFSLDSEDRKYDDRGRILSVNYKKESDGGSYVDPLIAAGKTWKDEYHYSAATLTGWTRTLSDGKKEEFDALGQIILDTDAAGRPARVSRVRYITKQDGPETAPVVQEVVGG